MVRHVVSFETGVDGHVDSHSGKGPAGLTFSLVDEHPGSAM